LTRTRNQPYLGNVLSGNQPSTVDHKKRKIAARLIREFIDCDLTNEEFDESYPDSYDRAIRIIGHILWFCYDDLYTHRLDGVHRLSDEGRARVERCIAFLETDLEYLGPMDSGKLYESTRRAWKWLTGSIESAAAVGSFDDPWWPFATEEQFLQYGNTEPRSRSEQ
jgi:hypothetical protein